MVNNKRRQLHDEPAEATTETMKKVADKMKNKAQQTTYRGNRLLDVCEMCDVVHKNLCCKACAKNNSQGYVMDFVKFLEK